MGFVNEYISKEDVEKYGLKEIDKHFIVGGTNARDWTVDRERDIYLRNVANGGGAEPEIRNQTKWTFFWHGVPLTLRLDLLTGGGGRGEPGWSHWRLVWVSGGDGLPAHLKSHKEIFLQDLKEALLAYKDGGVFSSCTSYEVVLDVTAGCSL